jgi:plastocyanin
VARDGWVRVGWSVIGIGAALVAGCSSGPDPVATVLVDYEHDAFATQFLRFVPEEVRAHPGDTVLFKQAWTGEPHTVTFGTLVADVLEVTRPLIEEWGDAAFEDIPPEVIEQFFEAEGELPMFYPDDPEATAEDVAEASIPQALAQPCLIASGQQLGDAEEPCDVRDLPPFDGTPAYYNSGIIPYDGPAGNAFTFTLAEDIAPGSYAFYCAVHGSFQSGILEVVPADEPLPPPEVTAARTRAEVNELTAPLEGLFSAAKREDYRFRGEEHRFNYAGLLPDEDQPTGIINEFLPKDLDATVGEPITWRLFGPHSISFDVPEYFPIVEFLDDGTVRSNEAIYEASGGAPPLPSEADVDPTQPLVIDGGTYDGEGFWSSGVLWHDLYVEYTVRFSRPGTYPFACLIHPPMVGTLRVTE